MRGTIPQSTTLRTLDANYTPKAHEALDRTRESMSKYYDRKVKQPPDIAVDDLVVLNSKKI